MCTGGPTGGLWVFSTYDGETNACERCEDKYCPYHHEPNNTPGKLGGHQCVGKDGPKLATLENWRKIVKHETKIENYMEALLRENVGDAPVTPYSGYLGAYNMGVIGYSITGKTPLKQGTSATGIPLVSAPEPTAETDSNPVADNWVKFYDTPRIWGYRDETGETWEEAATLENIQAEIDQAATIENVQAEMDRVDLPQKKVTAWTELVGRWKAVIGQSKHLVDITSLSPPVTDWPTKEKWENKLPGGLPKQTEACDAIIGGIVDCLEGWLDAATADPKTAPTLKIRILFGMTVVKIGAMWTYWERFKEKLAVELTAEELAERIANAVARGATPPLVLYGSDMGSPDYWHADLGIPSTFNHSKIVAGDGVYALAGGHNMAEELSSNTAPVIHDMTCEITGPGARSANAFAGSLWIKAAESGKLDILSFSWENHAFEDKTSDSKTLWAENGPGKQDLVEKRLHNKCLLLYYFDMTTLPAFAAVDHPAGSVQATAVLGAGRWGDISVFGEDCTGGLKLDAVIPPQHACQYAADVVKRMMILDPATKVIRMCQQDLVNDGPFGHHVKSEHTICQVLGERLREIPQGLAVQVVVSARFTQNAGGLAYSYGDGPREAAERISDVVAGYEQKSSRIKKLPKRLAVLDLSNALGDALTAPVHSVESSAQSSFCTVAPLSFCKATGATRARGGYVWPNAPYTPDTGNTGTVFDMFTPGFADYRYTNDHFRNKDDVGKITKYSSDMTVKDSPGKYGPGCHAKVLYVSEGAGADGDELDATGLVMIGSDNMYPSPLAEFSFVIEGEKAVKQFRTQYWEKLWQYSAPLGFTVRAPVDGDPESAGQVS